MIEAELKSIRKGFNLSQKCFAQMLDISVKTLRNYEQAQRMIPSPSKSLFLFARNNKVLFEETGADRITRVMEFHS
jgi:DNA-binding transcriptional regulator YiaG